jgi:hypothetical protein
MLVPKVYVTKIVVNFGIMYTTSAKIKRLATLIVLLVLQVHKMLQICGNNIFSIYIAKALNLSFVQCLTQS